jgi:ATP-dependent exoDNAse (exonuclease V) alpha subunit
MAEEDSHATMLQRELLYTAVTRAREELYIICEPETFVNGIKSQRVKGDTLAEKAEFFKGKLKDTDLFMAK